MTGIPTEADEAENERHREKARKHKAARDKIMATKTGEKGLLIVNTGTGKGKTSAALGMFFDISAMVILLRSCSSPNRRRGTPARRRCWRNSPSW
jgi:hypothetical protein